MNDAGDFDLQAAWLRRFSADAESSLGAFAQRLKEALPDLVTIQESRGFLSRSARITGVSIQLGDHRYDLELEKGRLKASIAMVVRGIALNTKPVAAAEWFARLSEETGKATAQAKALSQSLSAFMAR
jgi:hypothetical protein